MGKITKAHRHNSILQKRKRQEKIRKLKVRLSAPDLKNREGILLKLKKLDAMPVSMTNVKK